MVFFLHMTWLYSLVTSGNPTLNLLTNRFLSDMYALHSFQSEIQVSYRGYVAPSSCQSRDTEAFRVTQDNFTHSLLACFNNIPKIAEWLRNDKFTEGGVLMPWQVTDARKLNRKWRFWPQEPFCISSATLSWSNLGDRKNSCDPSYV